MLFTQPEFLVLFALVTTVYWSIPNLRVQNLLLLVASYVFYGWVHPWFCILLAISTVLDWACALGIARFPARRNAILGISVVGSLGLLFFFKYFNFFVDSVQLIGTKLGLSIPTPALAIALPVGISFYTFQTMSYVIDVWRGQLAARRSLVDFALFISFFPQLVAGPIERAGHLLPQIERPRRWDWERFFSAWPLLLIGFWKKLVFADSIAGTVDRIFMMKEPSLALLSAGALAFTVQVYADFSGYSDMARGLAKLLGFELMENFRTPFLARSLPEFWRRWHISLSSWIRDYIYVPLGGSRGGSTGRTFLALMTAMGLSGLWHGAAWNFVVWGLMQGLCLFAWRQLGFGSRWQPRTRLAALVGTAATFATFAASMLLFRAPSLGWLAHALTTHAPAHAAGDFVAACATLALAAAYMLPWTVHYLIERGGPRLRFVLAAYRWLLACLLLLLAHQGGRAFVYFQF